MSGIIKILRKIKRKYNNFKKNEFGGDALNNILILVITIIIIALLLVFAIETLETVKQDAMNLFDIPQSSYVNSFYFIKLHN